MEETQTKNLKDIIAKCPKCNSHLSVRIDLLSLDFKGGLATISILHGDPPHSTIVYLDKEGMVRGIEAIDIVVSLEREITKEERIENLEKFFGWRFFSALFSAYIADVPIVVIATSSENQIKDFFTQILTDYPLQIQVKTGLDVTGFGIHIVRDLSYSDIVKKVSPVFIYDMSTGQMRGYGVKSKLMDKLVKKWFGKGYKGALELVSEINKLKALFTKVLDEFNKSDKVILKKLIKELGLTNREIEYFQDLLRIKGIDVDKRMIWNPFMAV